MPPWPPALGRGWRMSRDATATEQAQLDLAARAVISYLEGEAVDLHNIERFGQHHDVIFKLSVVYIAYIDPRKPDLGRAQARQRVAEAWQILRPQHPLLAAAVEALLAPPIVEEPGYLPLPEGAGVDDARAAEASPWLDDYIAWSRRWAPRAFEDFHEACGLFDLATTAARRVRIEFGHGVYPSLYLGLAGRTTMWTKTTAADLAVGLLKQAGLG